MTPAEELTRPYIRALYVLQVLDVAYMLAAIPIICIERAANHSDDECHNLWAVSIALVVYAVFSLACADTLQAALREMKLTYNGFGGQSLDCGRYGDHLVFPAYMFPIICFLFGFTAGYFVVQFTSHSLGCHRAHPLFWVFSYVAVAYALIQWIAQLCIYLLGGCRGGSADSSFV